MKRSRAVSAIGAASLVLAGVGGAHAARGGSPRAHDSSAVTVRLGEYFFKPKRLTIPRGTPVRFVNVGKIEHTVADSTKGGAVRSRVIHPRPLKHGASQLVTFRKKGTVYYVCTFHPQLMRGVIVVR